MLQDQDSSDEQVPWERNGSGKVVITFETKNVPADWVAELQKELPGIAALSGYEARRDLPAKYELCVSNCGEWSRIRWQLRCC